jgi:hypothetical protein
MRSRCMSLLPRTTLHSDSEQYSFDIIAYVGIKCSNSYFTHGYKAIPSKSRDVTWKEPLIKYSDSTV